MMRSSRNLRTIAATALRARTRPAWPRQHDGFSRCFSSSASSNLLGHSPMAPHVPSSFSGPAQIPTAQDVTTSGGVWAPSSAKREKLNELKGELAEHKDTTKNLTLDDMATMEERMDLYFADGLTAIVSSVEGQAIDVSASDTVLAATLESIRELIPNEPLTQQQWESVLADISKTLEAKMAALPSDRCFKEVRDFFLPPPPATTSADEVTITEVPSKSPLKEHRHAEEAIVRFRLMLAQAVADHLKVSWTTLTAVSDQDIDRAAVTGLAVDKQATTLDADKLQSVITAFLTKDCAQRTEAMWALMDRDNDGLLDETEMNQVCHLTVEPVRMALLRLFKEALDASPVRASLVDVEEISDSTKVTPPAPMGWRQRRRESKEKKKLTKLFRHTVQAHFVDEVEMPHRMRCVYAWANKGHQANKIDSVLVDDAGWSGRKRYVELHPKISYAEFKEVQNEHFQHLDRVAAELVKGYREHLWVMQGRARQRRQLYRNCSLFLIGISVLDYTILAM